MDLDRILPRLFVGSSPERVQDLDRLKLEFDVTAVLNLQTDDDFGYLHLDWALLEAYYRETQIELRRVPVRDFDHEAMRRQLPACVQALDELLRGEHTTYVHCNMGAGRSPAVAITYLYWVLGWGLDRAVRHVRRCRRCAPDVEAIRLATQDRLRQAKAGE